jgi:hypothetical protein
MRVDREKMIPKSHGFREFCPLSICVELLNSYTVESLDRWYESRLLARLKELEPSS